MYENWDVRAIELSIAKAKSKNWNKFFKKQFYDFSKKNLHSWPRQPLISNNLF